MVNRKHFELNGGMDPICKWSIKRTMSLKRNLGGHDETLGDMMGHVNRQASFRNHQILLTSDVAPHPRCDSSKNLVLNEPLDKESTTATNKMQQADQ